MRGGIAPVVLPAPKCLFGATLRGVGYTVQWRPGRVCDPRVYRL